MSGSRSFTLLLVSAILTLPALAALADTIRVPADQPTIQAGVNAAVAGDVVKVSSGSYAETVVVSTSGITVAGSKSAEISGGGNGVPLTVSSADDVTVLGFTLREGSAANLRIVDSNRVLVTKLTSRLGSGFGIEVSGGTGIRLEKNAVFGPNLDCIEMDTGAGALVSGNKVSSCGGNGIDILSPDAQVVKNSIVIPDADGLTLRGGEVAEKNKVDRAGDDGIATSAGASVTRCKVTSPEEDGIQVDGNAGSYTSNSVKGAGNDCFQVTGTDNLFQSNKVGDCEDGFEIQGADNEFAGNKVSKTTDSGFAVDSNGNDFTGNQAKSLNDGFFVSGTGNTFVGNKSSSRDEDLRDLNPDDGTNTYTDNKFKNALFGPLP